MALQNNIYNALIKLGTPEDLANNISAKIGDTRQQVKTLKLELKTLEDKIKHLKTLFNLIIAIIITSLGCLLTLALSSIFK